MIITKKFHLIIFDTDKIEDFNKIVFEYADSISQSSSHSLFAASIVNATVTSQDLTYFYLSGKDESEVDDKLHQLIKQLDKLTSYYSITDDENGKVYSIIETVAALDIKFDNFECIPKGTYKKIDEIKNLINEFGYCKGYNPQFRIVEGNPIGDLEVQPETIYLFSDSDEHMKNLQNFLTERIMEIDTDFIVENRIFI